MTFTLLTTALRRSSTTLPTGVRAFSSSLSRDASWGFIGLGAMGYPMARNLRANIPKDEQLSVFDVNQATLERFSKEPVSSSGVVVAKSPREVVENADYIISALPEPKHVRSVFEELMSSPLPKPPTQSNRLFLDVSTIDPATSKEVAKLVKEKSGALFVDTPMSGGVYGASNGTLTFMIGCEKEQVPEIEKALLFMGKKVWHMGPQGTGLSGKLANNYALAINNIGCAEAMNMAIKWGITPKAMADLLNSATGKSWPSEINNPVPGVNEATPSSKGYAGGFGVALMNKDLRLAMAAAAEAGAKLELAPTAKKVYDEAESLHKGKDFSIVYQILKDKS